MRLVAAAARRVSGVTTRARRLLSRARFPDGARVILTYHGVTADGSTRFNSRFVSTRRLAADIALLQRVPGLRFVRPEDLAGDAGPEPRIVLSFDDGYRNFLTHALPVLEAAGVPATLFVTALRARDPAPEPILWADRVDLAARLLPAPIAIGEERFAVSRHGWRRVGDGTPLKQLCKRRDTGFLDAVARALPVEVALAGDPGLEDYWRLIDAAGLGELGAHPLVTVGSHGVSHASLPALTPDQADEELRRSRAWLEAATGRAVDLFAYPDGDYTPALVEQAAAAGYTAQYLLDYRSAADAADPCLYDRLGINPYIGSREQRAVVAAGGYGPIRAR